MSDETDVTSEVARVLLEHQCLVSYAGFRCKVGDWAYGSISNPEEAFIKHQAAMLAEAGLLRSDADLMPMARNIVSQLGDLYMDFTHPATPDRAEFVKYRQSTNDQADEFVLRMLRTVRTQQAQIATQEPAGEPDPECSCAACDPGMLLDGWASRMSVCPDCGNKRCPKAANHAKWQCSGSNETGQQGVPVAAGEPGVDSAGPGASGGLDGAPMDPLNISALLSQVARLEQDKDQWRDSANTAEAELREASRVIVRVRELADHYDARNGTALGRVSTGNAAASIRRALAGKDAT